MLKSYNYHYKIFLTNYINSVNLAANFVVVLCRNQNMQLIFAQEIARYCCKCDWI